MKPIPRLSLVITTLSFAVLASTGCAEKEAAAEAPSPPPAPATPAPINTVTPGTRATTPTETATAISTARWADIKDDTYDQRVHFSTGLKLLEARVNGQIAELVAKRTAMTSTTRTDEWDFAMKEMNNSRIYLRSVAEEMSQATPATWDQKKERVGNAWVRTQDALGKVKASTTS